MAGFRWFKVVARFSKYAVSYFRFQHIFSFSLVVRSIYTCLRRYIGTVFMNRSQNNVL